MSSGKFDYKQFKELYKNVTSIQKDFDKWLHQFLLEEAMRALKLVRPITPVDTGTLRGSWEISRVERTGSSLVVYLTNPMEYASFMEDGFTYQTKDGAKRFQGFHMAELSILRVSQAMPARFGREFKKWLARKGWK